MKNFKIALKKFKSNRKKSKDKVKINQMYKKNNS